MREDGADPLDGSATRGVWDSIEKRLRDRDASVRALAVDQLSERSDCVERMLPLLAIALNDSDPTTRALAEHVCGEMGRGMSDERARWVETQIGVEDRELAARVALLGRYFTAQDLAVRAARAAHICWLIERHPESAIAGKPEALLLAFREPEHYALAKELWLKQCAARGSNAAVLGNAASFFTLNEPETAEKLLIAAQTLEPERPEWREALGHLYTLNSTRGPQAARSGSARKALVELEMAEQIRSAHSGAPGGEEARELDFLTRLWRLPARARAAFDAGELQVARRLAEECLALMASDDIPEHFRNDGDAAHHGHLILGRVCLREGDKERAKIHLIEAGKTRGSPQLGSFGPNMALAKELLEQGESDVVRKYLELCRKFWDGHSDLLDEWQERIERGESPRFGANLNY